MMLHLCKGMNVAIEAVSCRGMKVTEEGADACYQNPRMPLILIPMPDHQSVWSMILIPSSYWSLIVPARWSVWRATVLELFKSIIHSCSENMSLYVTLLYIFHYFKRM